METIMGDIADELLIINKITLERLFKEENSGDLIALYILYYHTAKWQKTNKIWATNEYCMQKLGWGKDKLINTKKKLESLDLIDQPISRKSDGTLDKQYISVKYVVFGHQRAEKPPLDRTTSGETATYALNTNTVDALNINKDMLGHSQKEKPTFDEYMESIGMEPYEIVTEDGAYDSYKTASGSVLSLGKVDVYKKQYDKKFGKKEEGLDEMAKSIKPLSEVEQVIQIFSYNPASVTWFKNKTQLNAIKQLLEICSVQEMTQLVFGAKELRKTDNFAPEIDTPYELLTKMIKLKNRSDKGNGGMVIV